MEVGEWLRGLGLVDYAPAFRDNNIDSRVLLQLVAKICVISASHRSVIADGCSTPSPPCALTRARKHRHPTLFPQQTEPSRISPSTAMSR
jgi:hypothetical protein